MTIKRIVSGGQTGADRGGLDAAADLGLERGGYCPAGRRAEDGVIPPGYPLLQTFSGGYSQRTKLNVYHSDATVVFTQGALTPGSALTLTAAKEKNRPALHVDVDALVDKLRLRKWLAETSPGVLNVAGSRESKAPGIGAKVRKLLVEVLRTDSVRFAGSSDPK